MIHLDKSAIAVALRKETFQIMRFGMVGISATLLHLCIALTLNFVFGVSPQAANLIAFSCALIVSFLLHHSFSFRSTRKRAEALPRFFVAAGSGYLASAVGLAQLETMSLPTSISLILSACLIPAVSYFVNRYWVF